MARTGEVLEALRRRGCRITRPRRAVVDVLASAEGHLTAQELVDGVRMHEPGVGRVSVYRTLNLLVQLGLAQTSNLGSPTATYILTPNGRHHHVVCLSCHRVTELDGCLLEQATAGELALPGGLVVPGYRVEGHLLELYGYCPECLAGGRGRVK